MRLIQQKIVLEEMIFHAYHGVFPQERIVGGRYRILLCLYLSNIGKAIEEDDLTATVNYAEVYEAVKQEMQQPSALIEHVAGRILKRVFQAFPLVEKIKIALSKEHPPIRGAEIKSATLEVTADRGEE